MKQEELNSILRLHKAWLIGKEFGERAKLGGTDLYHARLRGADLQSAILEDSDLRGADLQHSDLRDADIDYASWPLWCGSLKAYVDDRIAIQLLYHTLSVVQHSPYV